MTEVRTALEGTDDDAVKTAVDKLNAAAAKVGEAMYAAAQASQQGSSDGATGADANGSSSDGASADDDDVVDAEVIDDDSNAGTAR